MTGRGTETEIVGYGDTDRKAAMCALGAMTIVQQSAGHLTDDSVRATDDWNTAENETMNGRGNTDQAKATTHANSPQTCTTTGEAASEKGRNHTGGRAAGVSTNEGGVEPGPIAHPPR